MQSKQILIITIAFIFSLSTMAQMKLEDKPTAIKWYSFEEAMAKNSQFPKKKIFVDVYTDWCGWCKKMDATTFSNPEIINYMNENYYAVKLNAERKDSIVIEGKLFVNLNPTANRSTHQIAEMLLNNRMSYPSYAFLDEMGRSITVVPGYIEAASFEPILHYFGDNQYLKVAWETYQKQRLSHQSTVPTESKKEERPTSVEKTIVKMEMVNGILQIPVEVNGVTMFFIFDTGASTISISETEANFLWKQGKLTKNDIIGTANFSDANGDISEGTIIILRTVKIGDRVLKNVEASVVDNLNAPLLFGQSALGKFGKISIDNNKREITFE